MGIQAPATAANADGSAKPPRPPRAIALAIDRSGSMAGPPLQEAKRCAAFVADRLRGDDQVAPVNFDNRVHTLQAALPRGDGYTLKAAISGIQAGGNTNLHGGWRAVFLLQHVAPARRAQRIHDAFRGGKGHLPAPEKSATQNRVSAPAGWV